MAISRLTVSLTLSAVPSTSVTGIPAHSAIEASSVKSVAADLRRPFHARRGWRQRRKDCGVWAAKSCCARHRFHDRAVAVGALQRVGDGHCGQHGRRTVGQRGGDAIEQSMIEERANGIVDHDMGDAACSSDASSPRAPIAAGSRRHERVSIGVADSDVDGTPLRTAPRRRDG